jgi:2-methylisocitrate lyase-like PEP mutase family enzyme
MAPIRSQSAGIERSAAAAAQPGHVGRSAGLVDEDELARIKLRLLLLPVRACRADVFAVLFGGVQAFFGINLEDGTPHPERPIRSVEDAVERIRAAREAARAEDVPLVINARIDLYLKHIGDDETRFAETVRRGQAYMAAGADCVFPFGLTDLKTISELVAALRSPINIVGRAGMPSIARLEQLGVARVSTASGPSLVAMSLTQKIAQDLHEKANSMCLNRL